MSDETNHAVKSEAKGGTRHRSPNYPMFDLGTAIARTNRFRARAQRNTVDADTAVEAIGYKAGSAGGNRALGALLGYGLLDEIKSATGKRQIKLSAMAYRMLALLTEDDPERLELIRYAALKPKVYADIVNHFPDLEDLDDRVIRNYLVLEQNFNPETVLDVIKGFRATYDFAKLGEHGTLSDTEPDKSGEEDEDEYTHRTTKTGLKIKMRKGTSSSGEVTMTNQGQELQSRTLAIPMMFGRELLLQAPEAPIRSDVPYLNLLENYIGLLKQQAQNAPDPQIDEEE
jgi:hypothetical protein